MKINQVTIVSSRTRRIAIKGSIAQVMLSQHQPSAKMKGQGMTKSRLRT
ncbi:hypothetical protein ACFSTD_11165 [Novosphingobium colocasiae]